MPTCVQVTDLLDRCQWDVWSTVTVLPTSTSAQASVFRPEVVIAGRETKILIDQVRAIDVSYVLATSSIA